MAEDKKDEKHINDVEDTKPKSKKKLFIILGAVVLLAAGGGGGAYMFGAFGHKDSKASNGSSKVVSEHTTTLSVPSVTANLDNGNGRTVYVKMVANVEFKGTEDVAVLQTHVSELQDIFQTYLHESRPQDLKGNGFYRLKESMLRRVRIEMKPLNVTNLYITELLSQ